MLKSINILKRYYKLASVKKSYLYLQFFLLLLPALLSTLNPILTAKIISALTVYDFSKAIYILSLDFIIVFSTSIFYFLYHLISRKINTILFKNFHTYIYENIKKNDNISSLDLSTITNITKCIDFNKTFLFKFCFFIKSIITLGIIFYYNTIISLVIISVSFVTYLLLRITDKKIQLLNKSQTDLQEKSLNLLNSIHNGQSVEENYNLSEMLKVKYFDLINSQTKNKNNISLCFSINNNFISLLLKITIFISTITLINDIKSTFLTLSVYLVLTPYLTSSAQNLISFFELFTEFGDIENILDSLDSLEFQEKQLPKTQITFDNYNLHLYNISAYSKSSHLKNIHANFLFGKHYYINPSNKSDGLLLFDILIRKTPLSSGTIFIDDKNAYDLPLETYRKIITYTDENPKFFNLSINENLLMVCKNQKLIKKSLLSTKLKEKIELLPQKENTIIDNNLDKNLLFVLAFIRCYLAGAKIICVKNLPYEMPSDYLEIFKNTIAFLKNKCTLIVFGNQKQILIKTDKKYLLKKNTIEEI